MRIPGGCLFAGWLVRGSAMILAALGLPMIAFSAVTSTTLHSPDYDGLDSFLSDDDLIEGMIPIENPGDQGWHPENTNPADQLVIFTDGLGGIRPLAGLLNDFPGAGNPTKVIEYVFDDPVDIGRINILTGNRNDKDGRIFSTTVVNYSTDGINFDLLRYFQSDPSGTLNHGGLPDPQAATLVSIFDDASSTMLSGVTNLEFLFFAVDNTGGQMRDPFDGVNPYTGVDDGLSAAFVSPLVWEIDVLAPSEGLDGDYNGDGKVDAADYVVWRNDPTAFGGNPAGYNTWRTNFGNMIGTGGSGTGSGLSTVPEPAALASLLLMLSIPLTTARMRAHSNS